MSFFRYWGKACPTTGAYHLAAFHSLDVAAVAQRRLERSDVLRSKLSVLLALSVDRVPPTVAAWIALHDIGKLDIRFQLKRRELAVTLRPTRGACAFTGAYDHGAWGYHQLRRELAAEVALGLGNIDPILQAVTGHHGVLPSKARRRTDEDAEPFAVEDRAARAAFLRDVAAVFRARGAALPHNFTGSFPAVALVAGLCSVADWIGSQEDYFPLESEPTAIEIYFERALGLADKALDALNLDAPASARSFAALFPTTPAPRDVQILTEAVPVSSDPRLVVVEAQTGAGKTEAAISLVARMLAAGAASGLFLALPTMATSNGLFARIEDIVPRMFNGPVNLLLAHSAARRSSGMKRLIERDVVRRYSDDAADEEASAVCAKWYLSPKRALASQVGVGTVDQAMVAALRVRHHFVRVYGLAQNVVVLDEIHAYDAYMSVVLERLVEWLGALRTSVILLSATLPEERRVAFEAAYSRGAFGQEGATSSTEVAYPMVTVVDRGGRTTSTLPAPPTGHSVTVERVATSQPTADVLPRLLEAAKRGRVAWIRNTVGEAQAAWDAAREAGARPVLFHARMRARDRARVEDQVLHGYGRGGAVEAGLVIATQVVEQSLDLDFDLLASDLAPVDLLLQRAGRLHRHLDTRPRPSGFDRRLVVVAPPPDGVAALRFGPSRYVYDPVTLWIAHDLLAAHPRLTVPDDVRHLVEETYGTTNRAARIARSEIVVVLTRAEEKRLERRRTSEAHATSCAIPPADFDPVHLRAAEDDDETVQALTREGVSVKVLPVLWNERDRRASTLDGESLLLDPEAADAWREADLVQEELISVPIYRARDEVLAAPSFEVWRKRAHAFAEALRLGRLLIVPMHAKEGVFSGLVESPGGPLHVTYTIDRGLAFS